MPWGAIIAAASSALYSIEAGDKIIPVERVSDVMWLPNQGFPDYPTECPSCHSHEFRMHHGRWVCSFCRSSA